MGHVFSHDRLTRAIREEDPQGVHRRLTRHLHRRKAFISPGPNFCWSIDAHDKLHHWGFDIYAAVDQYSRFVPWLYCGITAHIQVSVFTQYVTIVKKHGFYPVFLRSDRSVET